MRQTELLRRSVLKAITYRLFIVTLDFVTLDVLTELLDVTVWLMLASNLFTTVAYCCHERIWAQVAWGMTIGEVLATLPPTLPPGNSELSAPPKQHDHHASTSRRHL